MGAELTYKEPTLGDVLKDMWRAKFALIIGAVFGAIIGAAVMFTAVPQYKASMLIGPTARAGGAPNISALLPSKSGIAFEYMMRSLGTAGNSDFTRFEHILREPTVAARLLEHDGTKEKLAEDRAFRFVKTEVPETPEQFADYLRKRFKIEPVGTTNMRRLVYIHPDPDFALFLVQAVYKVADSLIQGEIQIRTEERIAYLHNALDATTHPDHREILVSMLMEQEHFRMVMAMDEAYAAEITEPATVSSKPYWPRKPFVYSISVLIGIFLGYLLHNQRASNT
jgi:uncharacterized protein involved in exopolysaccharide biosynthesis